MDGFDWIVVILVAWAWVATAALVWLLLHMVGMIRVVQNDDEQGTGVHEYRCPTHGIIRSTLDRGAISHLGCGGYSPRVK